MKRIAFAVLAMSAVPAMAQPQAVDETKPISRAEISAKLDTDYADMDADKNGKVTAAEITARVKKSAEAQIEMAKKDRDTTFAKLDTNSDGSVSRAEFEAGVKLPKMGEPDAKPFLDRFDANKDGDITKDEFRAPTMANFEKIDANKDGIITPAEIKNPPPTPRKKASFKETPPVGR